MTLETVSDDTEAAPEAPPPTFDDLALGQEVKQALDEIGWTNPTPVQQETYEPATARKDLIVQARTGTGKTGAFGIPIVDKLVATDGGVQALVLAPTRELALQSAREMEKFAKHKDLSVVAVYGGAGGS